MTENILFFVVVVVIVIFLTVAVYIRLRNKASFTHKIKERKIQLSPAVSHIQEQYRTGLTYEAVNHIEIDLTDDFTRLELGIPEPLSSLKTVPQFVREQQMKGHRILGATNAAFYLGNGIPANLIAVDNTIVHYGILGERFESPTQKPVAFGISKTGHAIADYYSSKLSFKIEGKEYSIDYMDHPRSERKTVLYTPKQMTTGTDEKGVELVIVTSRMKNTDSLHFGGQVTGRILSITPYGEQGNSDIPENGFVISTANQILISKVSSLRVGSPIEIHATIDERWMDAQFMLGAGPLLVKDGAVHISMPEQSSFVRSRQPRTAVAVDSTGKRVFLVTVDGRQSGHSTGTSLVDLAYFLISKGAYAAINLDGGGSTTMVAAQCAESHPILVNKPSDGRERKVSAILQVNRWD